MFDPKTKKYPYPEYTDEHYIVIKKNNGLIFDKDFPYINNSRSFRFKRWWFRIFVNTLVILVSNIRLGLRVKGKNNLKKHKNVIKKGIISCCNHIHYWDYLGFYYAVRPYQPHFIAWAKNIRGSLGKTMIYMGAIPIPDNNIRGQMSFIKTIGVYLNSGGWLHIYPEGSMWEYYKPIRPLKKGASIFACKYDKPILPMAYTYRKPNWIRRVIFRQIACLTLNIGEPIYKNDLLSKGEQEKDLTIRLHKEMCKLSGVEPKNNLYDPIFDNSKKINYY